MIDIPIYIEQKGDFSKTEGYLKMGIDALNKVDLDKYGKAGVEALRKYTPKDTGLTADSWSYSISKSNGRKSIIFSNSNIKNNIPIAIILYYGHATNFGGYVQGVDYISPALNPIFKKLADDAWKEVIWYR